MNTLEKKEVNTDVAPSLTLLPWDAVLETGKAVTVGSRKHLANEWQSHQREEHLDAALRHIGAVLVGQEIDDETNCHHLALAASRILFALSQSIPENS